ncbi:MAG: T9SS type A sorting domain-containing protein [Ignavibacteriae bacterium]|nr:T9SS type A sorting domain-containing protein [Ignavibacteriota bacterium]
MYSDKFSGSCYAQWQIQTSGTSEHLSSICFTGTNNQIGYAVGHNGVVIKTTNLGLNWSSVNIPTLWNYNSVFFTNSDNGWVVGFEVYRTSNGGEDWTKVITNPEIAGFKVQFFDSENGWILGLKINTRLRIWKTTNGGDNWDTSTIILNPYISDPMDMHFPSVETGFISGGNTSSFIAKTITSGKNWFFQNVPYGRYISGINFKDNLTGWAISDSGNILKTTNGGTNWYKTNTVAYGGKKIYYKNINNNEQLWIIGANGSILYSGNLGNSWQSVTFNSGHFYEDLTFSGNNQTGIHIVGNNGMIIYSGNAGGVNIKKESSVNPQCFTLYQNYPNPFNPNTVIKYSLEKSGFVSLKVYDIMGKEMKILVNENKNIGDYEVNFHSENLASGIYFYRIKSGNFSETKCMLLIK